MAIKTYTIEELVAEVQPSKSRFSKLDSDRSAVLDRARECSKLTLPSVVTDSGHSESDELDTPYQAVGARLVHNLASKLLLALLPPNTSFFQLLVDEEVVAQASEQQEGAKDEIEKQLVLIEQDMMKQTEREALRIPIYEAVKGLIVGGNGFLYKTEKGMKSYRLADYVVSRDFSGNPVEMICTESVTKATLPKDILDQLAESDEIAEGEKVTIYIRAIKRNGVWYEYQEVEDVFVEGSGVIYQDEAKLPLIPLRWTSINGENYGRGLVEQYLGDFRSLEGLYQLLLEASSVMAKIVFGKRPGTTLDIDDLNNADNGEVILGDLENDITTHRVDKGNDLAVPQQMVQDLIRRLEQAFLVASSAARDSERTTATEIRYMAADLEKSLGGVYSILSLELQRPLAYLLLATSKVDIKALGIELIIVTGVEALGRNAELDKIRQFNSLIQELGSPEIVLSRMDVGVYISKIANSLSLDVSDLIKSEETLQQEQQAQQQQQLLAQGAGNMVDGATKPQNPQQQ